MSKQFDFKQFSLVQVHKLVLFDPEIGPYQVLPSWDSEDMGAMAMKGYSAFPLPSRLGLENIPTASLQKSIPQRVSWYDTKQPDSEVLVMLELWGIRITPSLPPLPGPLCPGVVASDKGPICGLNRTKP